MTDKPPDIPLEPRPDSTPFVAEVIELGDVRVRFGLPRFHKNKCQHLSLIYSTSERRVWCEDCERTIENFDAFMTLTRSFEAMVKKARHLLETAQEAMRATIIKRACKHLDRVWSGRVQAVQCPHCRGGLLPEDFEHGNLSWMSRELEIARREKNAKGK